MHIKKLSDLLCFGLIIQLLFTGSVWAQELPSPKSHFGFEIGTDYQLTNFTQTEAYFKKLAAASDRVEVKSIGKTEEGRNQYMLVISSPENLKQLDTYKSISQRLAHAEIDEQEARALAQQGKAVVWIDGGLHATETVGIHQLIETAWQLASREDPETLKILDEVIILLVHANPDGQELVSNWYMRRNDPKERSLSHLPRLYQKYGGHDNNRDFFMFNLQESRNMGHQLFLEWIPQIMYNHHQSGPAGTVVAGAPYRDPYNYVFDPILVTSLDALGAAMHTRLNVEDKPGYTQRKGSVFSTWYNGGLRTTTYFHNMVGLLTEIIGKPWPYEMPFVPDRLLPGGNSPNPILPQTWHFRQSIDYSISLNYAVLGYAARYRDEVLYNIYRMGRNSIERGRRDHWSFSPSKLEAIKTQYKADKDRSTVPNRIPEEYLEAVMKAPENRDARGYIIPSDQPDFPTAVKFLNALVRAGIVIHQAESEFSLEGKSYPAGSYIVKTDQAFRPHILDMFEPQDYPHDVQYPGGPPVPPYDAAGWTLAYLMGIEFDRILEEPDGPFQRLPIGELIQLPGQRTNPSAKYYRLSAEVNDSYLSVNELLKSGVSVSRDEQTGDFYVKATQASATLLDTLSARTGLSVETASAVPANSRDIVPSRIALWDRYGGSKPSGWLRWLMENFHFEATVIYPPDIDAGKLNAQYDVIILADGAVPAKSASKRKNTEAEADIPQEYRKRWGKITEAKSIPALTSFMENGGRVVTIGSSANLVDYLDLPVKNALTEMQDGKEVALDREKFYVPGSVMKTRVAEGQEATWGMQAYADVYFDESPIFELTGEALVKGTIKPLLWFDTDSPLRSGWAWGEAYLKDGVAAFQTSLGSGDLYVFGPLITFRGQPHGTFKLLFNLLYKHEDTRGTP